MQKVYDNTWNDSIKMKRSKSKSKQVKVVEKNFYLIVLELLKEKSSLKRLITKEFSKQRLNFYTASLRKKGFIKKIGYGTWEVTSTGIEELSRLKQEYLTSKSLSLGLMDDGFHSNIHALSIKVPISQGVLDFSDKGFSQESLRGWRPEYLRVVSPLGITLKNNNNKSVSIYLWAREIPRDFSVEALCLKALLFVADKLKRDFGVVVDVLEWKVVTKHLSVKNQDLDYCFNKGDKFEVVLNRLAEKISPNDDDRQAKAWVDNSPYLGMETDDLQYKENLILMPERVVQIHGLFLEFAKNVDLYNKNIELHLEVMSEIRSYIKELRDLSKDKKV